MRRLLEDTAGTSLTERLRDPNETAPVEAEEWLTQRRTVPEAMLHEHRIARLEERVMILEQALPATLAAVMTESQPVCTTISSLGVPGYRVLRPIPVTIRQDGGEFIATFFDANISTGGDTHQEAVANLQSLMADLYDELATTPLAELGPCLQRQKHVLTEFVCRTS
jgi:hypothetical protein